MSHYFKKDKAGKPEWHSNIKSHEKPKDEKYTRMIVALGFTGIHPRFEGDLRYFVKVDERGEAIEGSLIPATEIPEGYEYELHADGALTIPNDEEQDGGVADYNEDHIDEDSREVVNNASFEISAERAGV